MAFGEYSEQLGYEFVDENEMAASAKILFVLASLAFINGFILHNFFMISVISGIMVLNFAIGLLMGAKLAPTIWLGKFLVKKAPRKPIGAIQKKFAWVFGLIMGISVFGTSLLLLQDSSYFMTVCVLCMVCLTVLYFEVVLEVCFGCKLYGFALDMKWIKAPEIKPNCMGDNCNVE